MKLHTHITEWNEQKQGRFLVQRATTTTLLENNTWKRLP